MSIRIKLLIIALLMAPASARAGWFSYQFGKPMPQQIVTNPGAAAVPAIDGYGLAIGIMITGYLLRRRK